MDALADIADRFSQGFIRVSHTQDFVLPAVSEKDLPSLYEALRALNLHHAVGGLIGAGLLLLTPARVFSGLVPWLLLLATALFAAGPWLARRNAGQGHPAWRLPGLMGVAIYGGYFNGGLGILLMALYTLTGESRLNTVNALKNLNSFVLSLLSVAAFAVAGAIVWPQALWMMALATAGGWAGARLAKRLPVRWVRWLVMLTGLVMSGVFFVRS